jgi:hypothetical protein
MRISDLSSGRELKVLNRCNVDCTAAIKGVTMAEKKPPKPPTRKKDGLKKACWKGYTAVGTKKKGGKTVPNCVPKKPKPKPKKK